MSEPAIEFWEQSRLQPAGSLSMRRNSQRQGRRERIHARVVHPIDTPRLIADPLERRESRASSALTGIQLVIAAVIVHALVIVTFAVIGSVVGKHATFRPSERLTVSIVETARAEPPKVDMPPPVEAPPEPEFEAVPKPKKEVHRKPEKTPEVPVVAPQSEQPVAPRRVVGLNLESTVGGNGPAFAIGTSRMGQTDSQAKDPVQPQRTASIEAPQVPAKPQPGASQRVAAHIPTRDTAFEKPKRLQPNRPEYPPTLKAQGLEGDVVVQVDITADGRVTNVTIVRSSGQAAFDDAAKRAAAHEQFAPATRDGKAVAFTLSYSYRFRIED